MVIQYIVHHCKALHSAGTTYRTDGILLKRSMMQPNYEFTIKRTVFPTASITFKMEELKLTDDALQKILLIDQKIIAYGNQSLYVLALCVQFFREFGSHISCGPIVFGGIHNIKSSSSSFGKSEIATEKLAPAATVCVCTMHSANC